MARFTLGQDYTFLRLRQRPLRRHARHCPQRRAVRRFTDRRPLPTPRPGAQIYYTLDGTTPTTNSSLYTSPLVLSNSTSVTVFAAASGAVNSGVTSATFVDTSATGTGTGLTGQALTNTTATAFTNAAFNTPPTLTRVDPTINFNWSSTPPSPAIGLSNYCVRWTGTVQPQFNETYTFYATGDDGIRVFVNGQPLINGWVVEAATTYSNSLTLKASACSTISKWIISRPVAARWPNCNGAVPSNAHRPSFPRLNYIPIHQPASCPRKSPSTSPTNNASYTATASVTFDATAAAQYNGIDHVSFYSGGSLIATISNAPYVFTATGLGAGNYNFNAAATDGSGLASTSAPVNIMVNAGSGLPYGLTSRGTSPAFYNMPGASYRAYAGPAVTFRKPASLPQHAQYESGSRSDSAYAPNTPLWSDNAVKTRYMSVPLRRRPCHTRPANQLRPHRPVGLSLPEPSSSKPFP